MHPHTSFDHARFKNLVRNKWSVSLSMTGLMLVIYFGFILLLAFGRQVLAQKVGLYIPLGIPVGLGVIVSACVLTGLYVRWANTVYDRSVKDCIESMKG